MPNISIFTLLNGNIKSWIWFYPENEWFLPLKRPHCLFNCCSYWSHLKCTHCSHSQVGEVTSPSISQRFQSLANFHYGETPPQASPIRIFSSFENRRNLLPALSEGSASTTCKMQNNNNKKPISRQREGNAARQALCQSSENADLQGAILELFQL